MPRDREFHLWDRANAIDDIQKFTKGFTFEQFTKDALVSAAVERKFEIIGEALKQLEALFPGATASLPKVKLAIGMRDRLAHGYFDIDLDILWKAVFAELPTLRTAVQRDLDASAIDLTGTSDL